LARRHAGSRQRLALGLLVAALAYATSGGLPLLLARAGAEVVRRDGFWASVDGFHGWFGSYDMGSLVTTWCVDHGLAAPDHRYGYVPAEVLDHPPAVRRAMAWALGSHGDQPDRVTAAALTLVLHDMTRQRYPTGQLQLDRLGPGDLQGFEGQEGKVLELARSIRDDALAHAHLQGPFQLALRTGRLRPGERAVLVARLTDASGAAVPGVALRASLGAAPLRPVGGAVTDERGEQRFAFTPSVGTNRLTATGWVPDTVLKSFAPATARAQRVARPARLTVKAATQAHARAPEGAVQIEKVDTASGRPLPGAVLSVHHDADHDGSYETALGTTVSGYQPVKRTGLQPGNYQLKETVAPAGYEPASAPVSFRVSADETTRVSVPNRPLPVPPPVAPPRPRAVVSPHPVAAPPPRTAVQPGQLPATGRPLSQWCWAAFGLSASGALILGLADGRSRRAKSRARRLLAQLTKT
jgi:hypothetical protein